MFKLIKYVKPFLISVVTIIALLFVQAMSDLALPDYTSKIVNVGIQQGGIEQAIPEAIRKSKLEQLFIFMSLAEQSKVKAAYQLLDRSKLSKGEYDTAVASYPILAKEPIYQLTSDSTGDLIDLMEKPMLIVSGIEKSGNTGINLIQLAAMQPKMIEAMKIKIEKKFNGLSASMMTQAAIASVHQEYEAIGIDMRQKQTQYILKMGGLMLLIALIGMSASVVVGFLSAKVGAGLGKDLRNHVFRKVTGFSNAEFDRFSTASLITRSTNDIQQVQLLMIMVLRIVFYAPILGVGGIIKVYSGDSSMSWVIAVAVMAILSLVLVMFGVAIPKFKMIQQLVDRLNLVTREILTGIPVIRAFSTQRFEEQKFDQANVDLTKTTLFVTKMMTTMMPLMMLIMNGTTLLVIWVGGHQVDQGAMQVGDLMAFIQYSMQIIMAFLMISMVSVMLPRATVSANRINEVLQVENTILDAAHAQSFQGTLEGEVRFEHVHFRHHGAEEDALSDISFTAKPGQTTAFIGSTGSGKSTLINLIPRFYDVSAGKITIDGIDIRSVTQHELRQQIGYVPQKAVLFTGSIESNIGYGVDQISAEQLQQFADTAQASEFIQTMPEGYLTGIAQGGTNVSGGQKQRLSIARALAKQPQIYIFDDSFSALDYKTDASLRKALKEQMGQRTILLVAQRISTIMQADQIIVLEEGKIAGVGTHQQLLESCEVYQEIAYSQLSKEELAG